MRDLTPEERGVVEALGACANMHDLLPAIHPADEREFKTAIHAAQNVVLARPAVEAIQQESSLGGRA